MAVLLPTRKKLLSSIVPTDTADLPGDLTDLRCAICLGTLSDSPKEGESEHAVVLHKTHYYGEKCIRAWLGTNDSCPLCRLKIHSGTFGDLIVEAEEMTTRLATSLDPIDDREVLALLLRLAKHQSSAGLEQSIEALAQMRNARFDLRKSRLCRINNHPTLLILPKFSPHEPDWSRGRLEKEQWDKIVRVQFARTRMVIADMFESCYRRNLNRLAANPGAHVEVALHPLARKAYEVLMTKLLLLEIDSRYMRVRALHASLLQALKGEVCLQGLMDERMYGNRSGSDALVFLVDFVEDMIRCILLRMLELQKEEKTPVSLREVWLQAGLTWSIQ